MTNRKFDIDQYNKNANKYRSYTFTKEDGVIIEQYSDAIDYLEYEYPLGKLYKITRVYSLKGNLIKENMTLGRMNIGVFYEFDEEGNKTKAEDMEVDLPKKFLMDKEKKSMQEPEKAERILQWNTIKRKTVGMSYFLPVERTIILAQDMKLMPIPGK